MNEKTLVLNSNYQVINVMIWENAITHLYEGDAEVMYEWNKEINDFSPIQYDRTVSNYDKKYVYKIPAIIRMKGTNVSPKFKIVKYSKMNVLIRDNYKCQYCGFVGSHNSVDKSRRITVDHVIPLAKGGTSSFTNCVAACCSCNSKKSNFLLSEINMKLIRKPTTPSIGALRALKMSKRKIHPSWNKYINNSTTVI